MAKDGDMKGASNKRLVPELRFPEFEKDGEWHREKLCNIANTFSGGTPSVNNRDYYNGVIPFIRSGEINNIITELSLTHLGVEKSSAKIVEKGTILYALYGATSGEVAISKIRGAINQAILAIILNATYSTRYVYQFLKKEKAGIINQFLQGGQGNLSGTIVNNLSIPFPSYIEQQKIAECLSSIDEEISAIKEKVEQLRIHKKGLMQKLFPVVGKFVPECRFPEFKKDREWKEQKLEDVARTYSGGTPSVNNKEYYNGDIPFIRSGEINKDTTELFLTHWGVEKSSAKIIKEGTILYALYGATSGEVAISKIGGAINQAILAIIPDTEYSSLYIYQYLKNKKKNIINSYLQGGQGNLSGTIINNLRIPFPSPAEQQKIAECLSSIDELISLYENKVILLELHKKGLMQQLFPKLTKS